MENREIKFRGLYHQSVSNTIGWVYGNLILGTGPKGGKFAQIEHSDFHDYALYEVDPKTVGQYTGLKDADGVDVYHGDIVETINGRFAVEWNDDTCSFQFSDGSPINSGENYGTWKVVVGNVHENSELLTPPASQ